MMDARSARAKINDRVILVRKSVGNSTYDCVRSFKRLVKLDKIGHAGSLDPEARGLILILTGEATKLSNYLMDLPKRYVADVKLGEATDSQDGSGAVTRSGAWEHVNADMIRAVIPRFLGKRLQTPPMYSALKHKGQPLYLLARRGERIDRTPREIETYEISLVSFEPPVARFEVFCSRGLYLRVRDEEIGDTLGVPAHLCGLTRMRIGHFTLEEAVSDDAFGSLLEMESPGLSLSAALRHLPAVSLSAEQSRNLDRGIVPRLSAAPTGALPPAGSLLRLERPDGRLGAIAEMGLAGLVELRRVFREAGAGA
jgi:tRNA pseudouridine55 synthase